MVAAAAPEGNLGTTYVYPPANYGLELFAKRSVKVLLDAIPDVPLLVPSHLGIHEAARIALARPQETTFEPVVVVFGGSRYRLKLHKAQDRVAEINHRAVEIARKVADHAERPVVVAASIGPTGELFEPLVPLTHAEGVDAFAEQARALASAGADVLWIETMSSKDEVRAAAEGAASTGMPYVCTLSFKNRAHRI